MAKRLVSIITPTFNRPGTLKRAIQSVLNQSYPDFEQIIVNDGGEDASGLVKSFSDSRLRDFNRPHHGKAAVLNFALSQVAGDYVTYLDDDDVIYPEHLSLLVAALNDNPEYQAAYSDTYVIYQRLINGSWSDVHTDVVNDLDVDYSMLYWQNYICHNNLIHTRKIAAEVGGYDESLPVLIDWDFIRRLANKTGLVHVKKNTAGYYRRVGESDSKTAIYVQNHELFTATEEKIMAKLPKPVEIRKKIPPLKVNLEPLKKLPELDAGARLLLFRSAPMEIFYQASQKILGLYPGVTIDVLGQPAVKNELANLSGINQVLVYEIGHFDPAHLDKGLLDAIIGNNYDLGAGGI